MKSGCRKVFFGFCCARVLRGVGGGGVPTCFFCLCAAFPLPSYPLHHSLDTLSTPPTLLPPTYLPYRPSTSYLIYATYLPTYYPLPYLPYLRAITSTCRLPTYLLPTFLPTYLPVCL